MSHFSKLASIFSVAAIMLYLFTSATFLPFFKTHKNLDHDKVVKYVLKEVSYELTYGDKNINIESFVDNAVKEALQTN